MKKKIVIILLVIAGVALMAFLLSRFLKPKKMTIADLQKKDPLYEDLVSIAYYSGGGMDGSRESREFYLDSDNHVYYKTSSSTMPADLDREKLYRIRDDQAIKDLSDYIREYNISVWPTYLPESDIYALDAPSTSYTFRFRVPDSKFTEAVTLSDQLELPDDGWQVIRTMNEKIASYVADSDLIDSYYYDSYTGEKIHVGRDFENTDEQAEALLKGEWLSYDDNVYLTYYSNEGFYIRNFYQEGDEECVLEEFVHEPYKECDSSWYAVVHPQSAEEHKIILALDGEKLLIEDDDHRVLMDKY